MGNLRYDFTGRTAIVTGGARGIGLELGRMFHSAGAEVFLIDFDEEELAKANADVGARGAHFRAQTYGRVINVTSYTGLHGNVGQANYATAKAGIIGFTRTAAKELGRFGVTVNAISPNAQTRMVEAIPPDRRAELAAATPLGRFGEAAEMAAAVAFLASEEAGYVTGVVLPVDGGLSI